jgi:hypothetical protein
MNQLGVTQILERVGFQVEDFLYSREKNCCLGPNIVDTRNSE